MGNAKDLFDTKYFTRIYMTQVNPSKWSRLSLCLSGHFSPQNVFHHATMSVLSARAFASLYLSRLKIYAVNPSNASASSLTVCTPSLRMALAL